MNPKIEQQIQLLERQLHSADVRADSDKLNTLLHDDFKEIGCSGRVYTKSDILSQLADRKSSHEIVSENFQFSSLSETIILVTYRSYRQINTTQSHWTLRSSVWILEQGRWYMFFHQGTPANSYEFTQLLSMES